MNLKEEKKLKSLTPGNSMLYFPISTGTTTCSLNTPKHTSLCLAERAEQTAKKAKINVTTDFIFTYCKLISSRTMDLVYMLKNPFLVDQTID